MRLPLTPLLLTLLSALTTGPAAADIVRFEHGRWLEEAPEGSALVERTWCSIDGLLRACPATVDTVVDLGGGVVVPPLADAHRHALQSAGAGLDHEISQLLGAGVFALANPNAIASLTTAARPRLGGPESLDATFAYPGLTGPGGHPVQIWRSVAGQLGWEPARMDGEAYLEVADLAGLDGAFAKLAAMRPDFVKIYLERSEDHAARRDDPAFFGRRGLDPSLVGPLVERAHGAGLRVSAHVSSAADFRAAVAAGVDELAHLPLGRITAEDAAEAARRGVTVVTTVVSHRPTDGWPDPRGAMAENLRLLAAAGARLVLGTDSHRTVLDEMDAIAAMGVLSTERLVTLATRDTIRWILPDRPVGDLGEGREASFLVLAGDPRNDLAQLRRIRMRVKGGHLLQVEAPAESGATAPHH